MKIYKNKGIIYSEYVFDRLSSKIDRKDLTICADTFYNCREVGFCFHILKFGDSFKQLNVWVYAHRNTDNPTIVFGEGNTDNMFNESEWENNQYSFINIEDLIEEICELIEQNFGSEEEK